MVKVITVRDEDTVWDVSNLILFKSGETKLFLLFYDTLSHSIA